MPAEAPQRTEPPAFLVKEPAAEARHEEPRYEEPRREEFKPEEPRHEEPRQEPRQEPRHEEPKRAEPRIDAKPLLEDAGLVMVETSSKPSYRPEEEQPAHLGRPRRERPKPASQDDELVQIETTRK